MSCALINLSLLFTLINLIEEKISFVYQHQKKKSMSLRIRFASPRSVYESTENEHKKKAQPHINKPQKESEWCSQTSQFEFQMLEYRVFEKWKPPQSTESNDFKSGTECWSPHKPTQPGYSKHTGMVVFRKTSWMRTTLGLHTFQVLAKLTHSIFAV